jgi:hypothetical protein
MAEVASDPHDVVGPAHLTAHEERRRHGEEEKVEGAGEVELERAQLLAAVLVLHGE